MATLPLVHPTATSASPLPSPPATSATAATRLPSTVKTYRSSKQTHRQTAMVAQLLVATGIVLTLGITYVSMPGAALFPWHPTCMAVGLLALMSYGISLFAPGASSLSYWDKVWRHFLCNIAAAAFVFAGFVAIFLNKDLRGKSHFVTWHGLIGLFVTILIVAQAAGSSILLSPSLTQKLVGKSNYALVKRLHRQGAVFVYGASMGEVVLGYYSNFWNRNVSGLPWLAATALTALMAALVFLQVFRVLSKRKD
ncbi:hypothetical protein PTSG_00661 [Salpingoeca rosetta]|uniref:Cytochrome b561 domain-containing protein n=1 Tax=Salpingoeca rosetta (strain ATCC 50818 / BSB-021) TaxID=946362 RepID=F2TX45_SALR5|nr:uncharacterized protein PTSG_00661 [Salpingoeca rosetta]EGD75954.1 hypothetical protein PTSG_00661 [Salpingoeca rosetta]|eukprot:XP_004998130.1 hypothetical protein PTSG_00661 [Salpingoeca rosetta]